MAHVLEVLFAFVVVGTPLLVLERWWPAVRGQRFLRRGRGTDVAFALLNAFVTESAANVALFVVAFFVAGVLVVFSGAPRSPATMLEWLRMRSPVSHLSPLAQVLPALLVADLRGYWMHRSLHEGPLWRLHAVHHSARQLDWLAAVRNHPLAEIVSRTGVVVPLVLLGFDLRVLGDRRPGARPVGRLHPRQRPMAPGLSALLRGDPRVPPVAPRRRLGGARAGRRELRRPLPRVGPRLRYVFRAQRQPACFGPGTTRCRTASSRCSRTRCAAGERGAC